MIPPIRERLDAVGPEHRLAPEKQARAEERLARRDEVGLIPEERRELKRLLRDADEIMLRRAKAIEIRISG